MTLRAPYPGLRPFRRDESEIFFGREEQVDELLRRLSRHRFLAVVGESGCGKSSLVRAGLIAALQSGFMTTAGARWKIAAIRPGSHPLERLQKELLDSGVIAGEHDEATLGFLHSTLFRGPKGLASTLQLHPLPEGTNFLLLVDQFEELFRISRKADRDQADAFVALLLEATRQTEVPIYVVMTMRSDFLGDTAVFSGLPEAVNDGIYLTPKLTRAQRKASIEGPARVYGGEVEADLVNRLLNDMARDEVPLPLLQHLLMRMWQLAPPSTPHSDDEDEHGTTTSIRKVLTTTEYEQAGGLRDALNRHADEVFASLTATQQDVAKVTFNSLCERSRDEDSFRNARRPTSIEDIAAIAGTSSDRVIEVAERFRADDCHFVMPGSEEPLYPNTVIDISHESLMHTWARLQGWMDEQSWIRDTLDEILKDARRWAAASKGAISKGGEYLWARNPRYRRARTWQRNAGLYLATLRPEDYALASQFVDASRRRHWLGRLGIGAGALCVMAVLMQAIAPGIIEKLMHEGGEAALNKARERRPKLELAADMLIDDLRCLGVVERIESDNARNGAYSDYLRKGRDDERIKNEEKNWTSLAQLLLDRPCSEKLFEYQQKARSAGLLEIFATDKFGLNACMSQETSDNVQSDESWWLGAFVDNESSIGDIEYDESAEHWSIPVFLPVRDANGVAIGAAKAVFDLFSDKRYESYCED